MLSKGALNPADITVLFKMFSSMDPPPVELVRPEPRYRRRGGPCGRLYSAACFILPQIRVPAFLDLFMQSLFKPGSKINQDHKHKYIHILAYAASVVETWKKVEGWRDGGTDLHRRRSRSGAFIQLFLFNPRTSASTSTKTS